MKLNNYKVRIIDEKNLVDGNLRDFADFLRNANGGDLRVFFYFAIRIPRNSQFFSNFRLGISRVMTGLFDRKAHCIVFTPFRLIALYSTLSRQSRTFCRFYYERCCFFSTFNLYWIQRR